MAKTEKISVTLPRDLAGEIRATIPQGEVSSFFTEALKYYLAFRKQKIGLKIGYGIWSDRNHPELITSKDSTQYIRSLRDTDEERLKRLRETNAE